MGDLLPRFRRLLEAVSFVDCVAMGFVAGIVAALVLALAGCAPGPDWPVRPDPAQAAEAWCDGFTGEVYTDCILVVVARR